MTSRLEADARAIGASSIVDETTPAAVREALDGVKPLWFDPFEPPCLSMAPGLVDRALARRALLVVTEAGVEALEWKREHGEWPASLDGHVDPFTGGPLICEVTDDGGLRIAVAPERINDVEWRLRQTRTAAEPVRCPGVDEQDGDTHSVPVRRDYVRRRAATTLADMGDAAGAVVEGLGAALADDDAEVRQAASRALLGLGNAAETVLPELLRACRAPDWATRRSVVAALAFSGSDSREVLLALREARDDPALFVRVEAAGGLVRRAPDDDESLRVLLGALRGGVPATSAEIGAQWQATLHLSSVPGQEEPVVRTLLGAARHGNDLLLQIDDHVFEAMGERARVAVPLLRLAGEFEDEGVREWAQRALKLVR